MGTTNSAAFADVSAFDFGDESKATMFQKGGFELHLRATPKNSIQFTPVTVVEEPKKWLHNCIKQLTQLSKLDEGWDSYGAAAPNQSAIDSTLEVLNNLASEDLQPSSIDASVEGGICISFQTKGHYGDIECFNSGEIFAVTSKNGEDTVVWEIREPLFQTVPTVNRIKYFLQSS